MVSVGGVEFDVGLNLSGINREVSRLQRSIENQEATIKLGLDGVPKVERSVKTVRDLIESLSDRRILLDANVRQAQAKLDGLNARLKGIEGQRVKVDLNVADGLRKIETIDKRLEQLQGVKLQIDSGALSLTQREIAAIETEIEALSSKRIKVDADVTRARARLEGLDATVDKISADRIKLDLNTQQAQAKLDAVDRDIDQLRKTPNINIPLAVNDKGLKDANRELGLFQSTVAGFAGGAGFALLQTAIDGVTASLRAAVGVVQSAIGEYTGFEAGLTEFSVKARGAEVDMDSLAQAAKDLASVTSQTPTGVIDTATSLQTLGVIAGDVEGSLAGVVKLADLLGEDPVLSGKALQTGVNIFGEFGETTDTLADKIFTLFNTTAAGSSGGLDEVFQLFQQAGSFASAAGIGFDELAAAFGTLRDGGASAEVAATGLRTILASLASPSGEAAKALESIGVNAFDANGNFIGLTEVLQQFATATAGLSQESQLDLATTIFGREGVPAILTSIREVDGQFQSTLDNINSASGAVDTGLEQLNQSLERQGLLLQGQIASALTTVGQAIAPVSAAFLEFIDLLGQEVNLDLGPIQESAERLNSVLTQNPDLIAKITDAINELAESAISQIAQIIDGFTALAGNDQATDAFANSLKDLGGVVTDLGRLLRFLITSYERLAESAPRVKQGLAASLGPIGLIAANLKGLLSVLGSVGQAVVNFAGQFDALAPVVRALRQEIEQFGGVESQISLGVAANTRDGFNSLANADLSPQEQSSDTGGESQGGGSSTSAEDRLKEIRDAQDRTLTEIETRAAESKAALLAQGASDEAIALNEQKFLDERLAAQEDFRAQLAQLQTETGDEGVGSALADAERDSANARLAAQEDLARRREELLQEQRQDASETLDQLAQQERESIEGRIELADQEAEQKQDALDAQIEARKEALDAEITEEQRAFDQRVDLAKQELDEKKALLKEEQSARRDALKQRQDEERSAAESAFDEEERQILRRLELESLAPEDRAARQAEFDEQDAESAREEQALADLNRRREEFAAQQEAERKALAEREKAEAEALAEEQRALEQSIADEKLALEDSIGERRKALEDQIEAQRTALEDQIEARQRALQDELQASEESFRDRQRALDVANAQEIANILASARQQVTPRLKGGPVSPGNLYLGGEIGPEPMKIGGRWSMVGVNGPELFTVSSPGQVYPHNQLNQKLGELSGMKLTMPQNIMASVGQSAGYQQRMNGVASAISASLSDASLAKLGQAMGGREGDTTITANFYDRPTPAKDLLAIRRAEFKRRLKR